VRRSRDRFWAKGDSGDKHAAFSTLYECLVDVSRLLAPFTPFLAEELHRRLVCAMDDSAAESVHLVDYPEPREDRRDDALRASMGMVREIVALGLSVRANEKLKVRQPLGEAIVVLPESSVLDGFTDAIREELNVKKVTASTEPEKYVTFEIVPNFRALGPKLGKSMPQCKRALQAADGSALYASLEAEGRFELELDAGDGGDGNSITLTREEIGIRLKAREGFAAASEGERVVVLDTRIDDTLRREGYAREVVHHIQSARKKLDLAYEARIELTYAADGEVAAAVAEHGTWIADETLAVKVEAGSASEHTAEIDGQPFAFSIRVTD